MRRSFQSILYIEGWSMNSCALYTVKLRMKHKYKMQTASLCLLNTIYTFQEHMLWVSWKYKLPLPSTSSWKWCLFPIQMVNTRLLDTEKTFKFCFQLFDFKAFVASLLHWPYIIVIVQQKQHLVVLLTLCMVCASLQWWH